MTAHFVPRYYQQEALDNTFKYYEDGGRAGLIILPTGTGKSPLPAWIFKRWFEEKPFSKALMLTHDATLIEQNYKTLLKIWPDAPCGIHSAGLNARDIHDSIIYGGIQSIWKMAAELGKVDVIFIDEVHRMESSSEGMYGTFVSAVKTLNPDVFIIGTTATPYRLGQGSLLDGDVFTDVIIDKTQSEDFVRFIEEGILCDLRPPETDFKMDLEGIKTARGDYAIASMDEKFNRAEVSEKIADEVARGRGDRRVGITFAINISHGEELCAAYERRGIHSTIVHSKLGKKENKERLRAYMAGEYEMLVNVDKMTTGFDHPALCYMVMARPTKSPGLWVQMLGRGTRPFEGKEYTLVFDFAGNTIRLGPINAVTTPMKPGEKSAMGEMVAPGKKCPQCKLLIAAATRKCQCGYEFPWGEEISMSGEIIPGLLVRRTGRVEHRMFEISRASAKLTTSMSGNQMVRLEIHCKGLEVPIYEYMTLTRAAMGYARDTWEKLDFRAMFEFQDPEQFEQLAKEEVALMKGRDAVVHVNKEYRGKNKPEIIKIQGKGRR